MHPAVAHRRNIARNIARLFLLVSIVGILPGLLATGYMLSYIFIGAVIFLPVPVLGFMQIPFFSRRADGEVDDSDATWWLFVALYNAMLALVGCLFAESVEHGLAVGWLAFLFVAAMLAAVLDKGRGEDPADPEPPSAHSPIIP